MTLRASLVGAAFVLAACAHMPPANDGLTDAERQARLAVIPDWDMRGRLAIDTGKKSYQARVTWAQRGNALELEVHGFLGAGSFRIEGDRARLSITSGDGTEVLTDPERELSRRVGWWLPVTSLQYWLLGQPDPSYAAEARRSATGTLAALDQREWHVGYTQYQLADGLLVPRLMTLTYASLELRLAVTDWQPAEAQP